MSKTVGFAVGMPTDVDVARLIDRFGVPTPGTLIGYADVEALLRVSRQQSRFRTVTDAWRRKIDRESNIILAAVANEGFRALDSIGRVDFTSRKYKHNIRGLKRVGRWAVSTPRAGLSVEQVRALDYTGNTAGMLTLQAALEARKMRELPPQTDTAQG